jgi:glycosyltransferase involved in cell wall biosynthesis
MKILVNDFAGHPFPLQLSRSLAQAGHTILHTYFAGNNTPKGRVDPASDKLTIDAVPIAQKFRKHSLFSRRGADLSYGRTVQKRILDYRPDLVISANTPLDAQRILLATTHECAAAFVFWLQDLLSAEITFVLRKKGLPFSRVLASPYRPLERNLLQRSDAIVCIAEGFRATLEEWQVNPNKTFVIENWAPLDEVCPMPRETQWAREHGLDGKFRFLYAGTLGMKHRAELLLELARRFQSRKDIVTVVNAEGAGAEWLRKRMRSLRPGALLLLPFQPYEQVSEVLASGDVLLATLDEACGSSSFPSKTLAYLCAGRPILVACASDNLAAKIVRSAQAGAAVSPVVSDFVGAAERLLKDEHTRRLCGLRARAYAGRAFGIERITQRFLEVFEFARSACRRVSSSSSAQQAAAAAGR